MILLNGTDEDTLKRGPGRYLGSFMPGEGELIYVAGHRTTYSAPFSDIDALRPGDRVTLEVPYGTFEYRVARSVIVGPSQTDVLRSQGREVLALQSCHPRFFATHRYITYAKPVHVRPPGASTSIPARELERSALASPGIS
jgi:sortase A